jgi:Flp pilus assembly pilin Flp
MGSNLSLRKWFRRFAFSESGQGLVEYSVIISVLSVGLVAVLLVLGNSVGNVYNDARNGVDQAIACSSGTSTACTAGGADGGGTGTGTGGSGQGSNGNGNGGGNGQGNNGNGNTRPALKTARLRRNRVSFRAWHQPDSIPSPRHSSSCRS